MLYFPSYMWFILLHRTNFLFPFYALVCYTSDISLVMRYPQHLIPHRIHVCYIYIYGNIYHQFTPNVSIYTSTMDPSWVLYSLSDHFVFVPEQRREPFAAFATDQTPRRREVSPDRADWTPDVPWPRRCGCNCSAIWRFFNGQRRIYRNNQMDSDGIYGIMMVISLSWINYIYREFIRKYLLKMVIFQFATSNHHRVLRNLQKLQLYFVCLISISEYLHIKSHTYIYIILASLRGSEFMNLIRATLRALVYMYIYIYM